MMEPTARRFYRRRDSLCEKHRAELTRLIHSAREMVAACCAVAANPELDPESAREALRQLEPVRRSLDPLVGAAASTEENPFRSVVYISRLALPAPLRPGEVCMLPSCTEVGARCGA